MTDLMLKFMEGFHNQFYWRISGITYRQVGEVVWEQSSAEEALEAAGLWPMKE